MASKIVSFSQNASVNEYDDDESEYDHDDALDPIVDDYAEYFYENDEETSNDKDNFEQQIADSGHDKYAYDSYNIEDEDKPIRDGNDRKNEIIVSKLKEEDVSSHYRKNDDAGEEAYVNQNENSDEIHDDFTNESYSKHREEVTIESEAIHYMRDDSVENIIESLEIPDLSIGDKKEKDENEEGGNEDIFGLRISNELKEEGRESKTSMKKSPHSKKLFIAKDISTRFCPDEYLGGNCPSNCFSPPPRVKLRKSWMNTGNGNNSTSNDIGRLEIKSKGVSFTKEMEDEVKGRKAVKNEESINQTQNQQQTRFTTEEEIDSRIERKNKENTLNEKIPSNQMRWKETSLKRINNEKKKKQEVGIKNHIRKVENRKNKSMVEKYSPRNNIQGKYTDIVDNEKKQEQSTEAIVDIKPTVQYGNMDTNEQRKKYSKKTTDKGLRKIENGMKYSKNSGKTKSISEPNGSQNLIVKPKSKTIIALKHKKDSMSKHSPKNDRSQNKKGNIKNQKLNEMNAIKNGTTASFETSNAHISNGESNNVYDASDTVEEHEKSAHETQELKYRLAKLERQMHVIDVKRISQLADIEEATTRRMGEYRSKLHYNFNRKKRAMLEKKQMMEKQSIQSQGLSGTLRLSNQKLRTEIKKREQFILELKQVNQKLQDGNSSRGSYLDEMNRTLVMEVSVASALNKRLEEDIQKYHELITMLKSGINSKAKCGETEHATKNLNMNCMKKIIDLLIENNYDDQSLFEKINGTNMEEHLGQCNVFESHKPHHISCSSSNAITNRKKGESFESVSYVNQSTQSKAALDKMEIQLIPLDSIMMDDDDTISLCSTTTSASQSSDMYGISDFNTIQRISIPPF